MIEACPVEYFGDVKHVLFPTLLSICHHNRKNLSLLKQEHDASLEMLAEFIDAEITELETDDMIPTSW